MGLIGKKISIKFKIDSFESRAKNVKIDLDAIVLVGAAILDFFVGDPWNWLHPVQVIGWTISHLTQLAINYFQEGWQRRLAGVVIGLGLIVGSGLVGWSIVCSATWLHPLLGIIVEIVLLASCFAGRSLRRAAIDILQPLIAKDIKQARFRLSQYVGRDTKDLDESEILRATLETIAENTTDGVTAPLFYAIIGALIPGVGSIPLALAYKAASTLDSMVGYRKDPYKDIGWFSAQLEDRLTWFPCRLTVLTLALISGRPGRVLQICRRDGVKDSSPNSGWSECAYAAILEVQLGGVNFYGGVEKYKPLLGDPISSITPEKIYHALQLTRYCFLIWLAIAILLVVRIM
jgi:adenosylcobinamide-phosphate synthase